MLYLRGIYSISVNDIEFWTAKIEGSDYLRVYGRYKKKPISTNSLFGNGHALGFKDDLGMFASSLGALFFEPDTRNLYTFDYDWINNKKILLVCKVGQAQIKGGRLIPVFLKDTRYFFWNKGAELDSPDWIEFRFKGQVPRLNKQDLNEKMLSEIAKIDIIAR